MPITGPLRTGDFVLFQGSVYRVKMNGTAVFLQQKSETSAIGYGDVRCAKKKYLLKEAERAEEPDAGKDRETEPVWSPELRAQKALEAHEAVKSSGEAPPAPKKQEKARVPSTFFYVVRDIDAGAGDRRLKMGVSGNVPATLRAYRRRNPGDQVIFTVACASEGDARALEGVCKLEFAEFRLDASEVYKVRPHEVIRMLRRQRYVQNADGVFRLQGKRRGPGGGGKEKSKETGVCELCGRRAPEGEEK